MASVSSANDEVASSSIFEIDPRLYKAATKGNIEPFKEKNEHELALVVTPIKNTILHIYITSLRTPKSTMFVKQILKKCPALLLQVNVNGDTPLQVAARYGHYKIAKALIDFAKAVDEELESGLGTAKHMLRMKNNEGNTALHLAVRNDSFHAVNTLIEGDPDLSYYANNYGETPLFLAASVPSVRIVAKILETCELAAHEGADGKTALHAAVMANDLGSIRKIVEKKKFLTKEKDQNGWIPLHYAAYYGRLSIASSF